MKGPKEGDREGLESFILQARARSVTTCWGGGGSTLLVTVYFRPRVNFEYPAASRWVDSVRWSVGLFAERGREKHDEVYK